MSAEAQKKANKQTSDLLSVVLDHFTKEEIFNQHEALCIILGTYNALLQNLASEHGSDAKFLFRQNIKLVEISLVKMKKFEKTI